jgi:DNA-binding transcriptional regulator YiaG
VRGTYRFAESGLKCVVLQGVEIIRCPSCGNEDPIIPRVNQLMQALARAVVRKPYRLEGEEVRFLRKYLRMTQDQFARLIHLDKTNVSKWENNEDRVGPQSDRLIRAVALALGDGLREGQEEAVRDFAQIQDLRKPVCIELNTETMAVSYA